MCGRDLDCALQVCKDLGVAIASHKTEGPASSLCFLGILVDTDRMELRLPEEKIRRLQALLGEWRERKVCQKRQLLSLIGRLQHVCRVVRVGRPFLRRFIDLSTTAKKLHHRIRLNRAFRSDLLRWETFLGVWNGVSMIQRGGAGATLTSDASGGWGCGAWTSSGEWFQFQCWKTVHITVKELAPIVVAAAIWGRDWRGKTVRCQCDNAAVVAILRSSTSKHPLVVHLLRCLSFFLAYYCLFLDPVHLPGRHNEAADALSRDNVSLFMQLTPAAEPRPAHIPEGVLKTLVLSTPEWWSPDWISVLSTTLRTY